MEHTTTHTFYLDNLIKTINNDTIEKPISIRYKIVTVDDIPRNYFITITKNMRCVSLSKEQFIMERSKYLPIVKIIYNDISKFYLIIFEVANEPDDNEE